MIVIARKIIVTKRRKKKLNKKKSVKSDCKHKCKRLQPALRRLAVGRLEWTD
jgi:hypothetical protein